VSEETAMNKEQERKYLAEAREMVAANADFRVFHNHFFSQSSSLLKGLNKEQRKALVKSSLYRKLAELETQLGVDQGYLTIDNKTGKAVEREFSGEFRLRLAKSLHQKLVIEAKREHVSLNQLCLIKLAQPLETASGGNSTGLR